MTISERVRRLRQAFDCSERLIEILALLFEPREKISRSELENRIDAIFAEKDFPIIFERGSVFRLMLKNNFIKFSKTGSHFVLTREGVSLIDKMKYSKFPEVEKLEADGVLSKKRKLRQSRKYHERYLMGNAIYDSSAILRAIFENDPFGEFNEDIFKCYVLDLMTAEWHAIKSCIGVGNKKPNDKLVHSFFLKMIHANLIMLSGGNLLEDDVVRFVALTERGMEYCGICEPIPLKRSCKCKQDKYNEIASLVGAPVSGGLRRLKKIVKR